MLKTIFVLEKRLDKKGMVNFKINDVTDWTLNNSNTHISQHVKNQRQPDNGIWSVK